ncbi:MAG: translation elongation factor Ts [Pseudobdellovibrionaceae bacterium]
MAITATLVKELREKTSAGMLDCKKALEETGGDFEKAIEWLRVKGLSSAAKKADRVATEGLVQAWMSADRKTGVLVEVNSETDFVSRNDGFKALVADMAHHVGSTSGLEGQGEGSSLMTQTFAKNPSETVDVHLKNAIAKIGENLVVRRYVRINAKDGFAHTYIHGDGKIGVAVEVTTKSTDEAIRTFANDVCLHVAAMSPISITADDIPAEMVTKERAVLKAKALEQGKKPEMIDKIVEGQIKKWMAESCLLEQAFVKNPDQKVKDYMADVSKKTGQPLSIKQVVRFGLGEGLQKKSNDFAAEVAAQMKGH